MRFLRLLFPPVLFAATVLLGCGGLAAGVRAEETRIVPSGVNQQIDFFASVNPDCSSIGLPTVRLIDGPSRGVITTDKGRDFMPFPQSNLRHVCNRKRLSGLKLFYQSETGFFGTDRVRILIVSGSGTEREASYTINAR